MDDQTTQAFNDWIADRYEPSHTMKGRIRRRGGVVVYPDDVHRQLRRLLGGSYTAEAIRRARSGQDVGVQLERAIETLVELNDREAIRRHRRDDQLATALSHAQSHHDRTGHAPNGGDMEAWARRRRRRLDARYDVDAAPQGEAGELWSDVVEPSINQRRRKRWTNS